MKIRNAERLSALPKVQENILDDFLSQCMVVQYGIGCRVGFLPMTVEQHLKSLFIIIPDSLYQIMIAIVTDVLQAAAVDMECRTISILINKPTKVNPIAIRHVRMKEFRDRFRQLSTIVDLTVYVGKRICQTASAIP